MAALITFAKNAVPGFHLDGCTDGEESGAHGRGQAVEE